MLKYFIILVINLKVLPLAGVALFFRSQTSDNELAIPEIGNKKVEIQANHKQPASTLEGDLNALITCHSKTFGDRLLLIRNCSVVIH